MDRIEQETPPGGLDVTGIGFADLGPGLGITLGEAGAAGDLEPPFIRRISAGQPIAVPVEQHGVSRAAAGALAKPCQYALGAVIQYQHTGASAPFVEQRGRHANGGLQRLFDHAVFDVQIQRRDINLARGQVQRVGEVVAVRLGLQFALGDNGGLAVGIVHAYTFPAVQAEDAHLVVVAIVFFQVRKRSVRCWWCRGPCGTHSSAVDPNCG